MKIKNDSSVIDCTPIVIYDGCHPNRWVLRHIPEDHFPYVIHRENMRLASDGNTWEHSEFYNGHYFATLDNAAAEFKKKVV